ncbi:ArnT family glycosyltransferase [Phyllobacterium leguminum]|uniref:Dolichyl-phosphate-mannose-protein mannosyltransferase n=1 Tax=Phyllobacterium leguminum TaxID=314237 RepID=A0A318TKS4_9HYPH|nr:glycosyltransferase family 39 protein [Phyllobacterium leguminum]PYE90047.1 dolichyl-phosphate-mannose-protein mannosyltransferase [Phyllobacterium leguminum]
MDLNEPISTPSPRQVSGLHPALLFVLCYFAFQAVFVSFISNGAGLDDAEQLANIGYLSWGYGGSQPPLYTWITGFAAHFLGTSLLTLQIVKFGLLASMFASVYGGIHLLGLPRTVAAAGMLGLFLIPQIGWESQRALTHSVAGTTGCAWAFLAFAWHMRSRSLFSAGILGLTMAAALLGKFNAGFFVLGLVLTALTIPEYRTVLLSRRSFLTIGIFALCLAPTGWWMLEHKNSVLARSGKFEIDATGNFLLDRVVGVARLFEVGLLFSALAIIVAVVIFFLHRGKQKHAAAHLLPGERFLFRLILIGFAIVFVGICATGATNVKDRWLQPVLFLVPACLAWLLHRYRLTDRPLRDFSIASIVVAFLVTPVLAINLTYGSGRNDPPIGQLEYAQLFKQVHEDGDFSTVLADYPQIPGNFRLFDPSVQVVYPETPNAVSRIAKPLLVLWFGGNEPPEKVMDILNASHIMLPVDKIETAELPYRTRPDIKVPVHYVIVK